MTVVKKTWKWSSSRLPTTEKRGYSIYVRSFGVLASGSSTYVQTSSPVITVPSTFIAFGGNNKEVSTQCSLRRKRFRAVSEQTTRNESQIWALVPFFARQRPKIPFFVVVWSFFALKPHGNACCAGYTQCYMSSPLLFLSSGYTTTTNDFNSLPRTQPSTSFVYY